VLRSWSWLYTSWFEQRRRDTGHVAEIDDLALEGLQPLRVCRADGRQRERGKPTMFICGNDEAAKKIVSDILDQFGWEIADMGKVEAARAIEPLCMLWCIPGFLRNDWTHAFKLLRQE
jgi:hypothetical protein